MTYGPSQVTDKETVNTRFWLQTIYHIGIMQSLENVKNGLFLEKVMKNLEKSAYLK